MNSLFRRILRTALFPLVKYQGNCWNLPVFYPPVIPAQQLLDSWQTSEWPEYQLFIDQHSITTQRQWLRMYRQCRAWKEVPRISIITPVYNTKRMELIDCILSVRLQTLPAWELILSDDGSTSPETLAVLHSSMCRDPRIKIIYPDKTDAHGISAASNRAIDRAEGDYILFLDHDDRLAPDALQKVARQLILDPSLDIVYSDRDMISPDNKRYMHFCKPDWSPETLLSGNYLVHIMCFRKQLVEKVGGLRPEFDGAQDHDLLLRCSETNPNVAHVPEILYHYRQSEESVALNPEAKEYAYQAGIRCIKEFFQRKNIHAQVKEAKDLWRGNYNVFLPLKKQKEITRIAVNSSQPEEYATTVTAALSSGQAPSHVILLDRSISPVHSDSINILAAWCELENIAMVSGRLSDSSAALHYAGMHFKPDGSLVRQYEGFPVSEPGYMAVTRNMRNISAPNPYCVLFRFSLWQELNGFDSGYTGPYAILDLALRSLSAGYRILYQPQADFQCPADYCFDLSPEHDKIRFENQWDTWLLQGDPYYNKNFAPESICYEIAIPKQQTE